MTSSSAVTDSSYVSLSGAKPMLCATPCTVTSSAASVGVRTTVISNHW